MSTNGKRKPDTGPDPNAIFRAMGSLDEVAEKRASEWFMELYEYVEHLRRAGALLDGMQRVFEGVVRDGLFDNLDGDLVCAADSLAKEIATQVRMVQKGLPELADILRIQERVVANTVPAPKLRKRARRRK